jgi:hypothetical protein
MPQFDRIRRCARSIVRHPARAGVLLAVLALLVPLARTRAEKAPEPSPYPITPELEFKPGMPKRIVVSVPGELYPKAYWYLTYTVTNPNDKSFQYLPTFDLLDDAGKIHPSANKTLPHEVFDAIQRREGNKLLEPMSKIEGDIQPGEDLARDGVAIWPEPMQRMGTFSIFVGGLTGEYVILKKSGDQWLPINPKNSAAELKGVDEKDLKTLRKTLQLTYQVAGDEIRPGTDPIRLKSKQWVMR